MRFLFYRLKLVVEPSGALGVAAALEGRVGVILSGGNVDGEVMAEILARSESGEERASVGPDER